MDCALPIQLKIGLLLDWVRRKGTCAVYSAKPAKQRSVGSLGLSGRLSHYDRKSTHATKKHCVTTKLLDYSSVLQRSGMTFTRLHNVKENTRETQTPNEGGKRDMKGKK